MKVSSVHNFSVEAKSLKKQYLIPRSVEVRKQLSVDEVLAVIDDNIHDGLGHQVTCRLGHNLHIRVNQVPDGLHLSLQHRVHGGGAFRASLVTVTSLISDLIIQIWSKYTGKPRS